MALNISCNTNPTIVAIHANIPEATKPYAVLLKINCTRSKAVNFLPQNPAYSCQKHPINILVIDNMKPVTAITQKVFDIMAFLPIFYC